jgi:steroid 5-alpha reductase family enzyme
MDTRAMSVVMIILVALAVSFAMTFAWWLQQRTGKSGWIDCVWSFATGGAAVAMALWPLDGPAAWRALFVALMASGWSLRLGLHIAHRTVRGGDDPRYAQLAREWGADFRRRLFWFLQIQAACALLLALVICVAARNPSPFPAIADAVGLIVFVAALAGEALADRQLATFRADARNAGRVCDIGFWSWSRHPNYFFEWLVWIGFAVIAIDLSGHYPWGFAALAGPLFMYWLLVHVSGVPLLEAHMLRSRGAPFANYQARVNSFFPWPRRGVR